MSWCVDSVMVKSFSLQVHLNDRGNLQCILVFLCLFMCSHLQLYLSLRGFTKTEETGRQKPPKNA